MIKLAESDDKWGKIKDIPPTPERIIVVRYNEIMSSCTCWAQRLDEQWGLRLLQPTDIEFIYYGTSCAFCLSSLLEYLWGFVRWYGFQWSLNPEGWLKSVWFFAVILRLLAVILRHLAVILRQRLQALPQPTPVRHNGNTNIPQQCN